MSVRGLAESLTPDLDPYFQLTYGLIDPKNVQMNVIMPIYLSVFKHIGTGWFRSPCSIKETMQGLLTHTVCACMQQGQNLPQIHIPEVKTVTHIPDLVVNFSNTSTFWNSVFMPYFIKIKDIK